jgi:type III secretion system FlhB-like substrate exporter
MHRGHRPPMGADERSRGELVDRLLDLARESGLEVNDDSDLGDILGRLSAGTMIPAKAVSAMNEILGYIFRYDRELALSIERAGGDEVVNQSPVAERDEIGG